MFQTAIFGNEDEYKEVEDTAENSRMEERSTSFDKC